MEGVQSNQGTPWVSYRNAAIVGGVGAFGLVISGLAFAVLFNSSIARALHVSVLNQSLSGRILAFTTLGLGTTLALGGVAIAIGAHRSKKTNEFETNESDIAILFGTVKNILESNIGDYSYEPIPGSHNIKMKIKNQDNTFIEITIRQSTKHKHTYYRVLKDPVTGEERESPIRFTGRQLSTMMRMERNPPAGYHVSSINRGESFWKTGVIVFTQETIQKHCVVKDSGVIEEVSPLHIAALIVYSKKLP